MEEQVKQIKSLKFNYMQTFGTEAGDVVLKDLGKRCFKYNSTIGTSSQQTAFNEGMRAVLLHIETLLTQEVEDLINLIR